MTEHERSSQPMTVGECERIHTERQRLEDERQDGDGKPTGCTATPKYADNQTYLQAIMGSAFDSYVKAKGSAGN